MTTIVENTFFAAELYGQIAFILGNDGIVRSVGAAVDSVRGLF